MINLSKVILPGQTIGIIGGGQLGKMMTLSAKAMGYRVTVLDPTPDCPCGQVADEQIVGAYNDLSAIEQLARKCDVITYEFENIDAEALEWLTNNTYVPQGTEILRITQNRIYEKAAIQEAGAPVAPYRVIEKKEDLELAIGELQLPVVLKTATGGYDGKGQVVIKTIEDVKQALPLIQHGACVLEKWIAFKKELSVIITKNSNGDATVFPVAENIHKNNILHMTIAPARINDAIKEEAIRAAKQIADKLELVGTLAVELFLTEDDKIFINELAPRPHNSGHFSIEACITSQFEQHIRAVCNLPLGSTEIVKPAVMVNILGQHVEPLLTNLNNFKEWKIHLYGKSEAKHNRKMGHITRLCETHEEALAEIDNDMTFGKEQSHAN
ncbi:5-(carboxyamino)imidazole ribonucleotide synthase [Bacillus sp. P1(2020)]|uniref:N5-carboxyaminoimidazole ribonucleotide synthase n=1 Tax=Pallidibacillus pasinlerensis TaxID=2703818 RepID=A0ABX0A5C8_9BACI|nr:5-(carboxyamino)imidazole ribonucleotide synthase [Pallidibacillus pasinlerensis]NCU16630.1 5-(carboxyamino)imidazole ribonucleotide synthase [Pallidibacillus pasinlerensis]